MFRDFKKQAKEIIDTYQGKMSIGETKDKNNIYILDPNKKVARKILCKVRTSGKRHLFTE